MVVVMLRRLHANCCNAALWCDPGTAVTEINVL